MTPGKFHRPKPAQVVNAFGRIRQNTPEHAIGVLHRQRAPVRRPQDEADGARREDAGARRRAWNDFRAVQEGRRRNLSAHKEGTVMDKVTIGNATLYHADCMEVFPTLERVDCVITDPPYSENTHSNAKSNKGGSGAKAIDFKAIDFKAIESLLDECARICDGWVIANMDWRHIAALEFEKHSYYELIRFGIWMKSNPMPQISADRPANGWDGIAYIYPRDKKKAWNGGGCHGNWLGPVITNGDHPTGKPVDMVSSWVSRFTDRGQTVLDPFMGSGTTGVACVQLGRKFIGIEREPKYFDIACKRIQQAYSQPRLFFCDSQKAKQDELF